MNLKIMIRFTKTTVGTLLLVLITGCTAPSIPSGSNCSSDSAKLTQSPLTLQDLAIDCAGSNVVYAYIVAKLNSLPPPKAPKLILKPSVPSAQAEIFRFEMDVFFNVDQSYPPDIAFAKLNELIDRLGIGFDITSIEVKGNKNLNELESSSFDLREARSEFVLRYLLSAELPTAATTKILLLNPKQPNTPEGNARDRVVEITVVGLRKKRNLL